MSNRARAGLTPGYAAIRRRRCACAFWPGHEYSYSFPLIFFNVEDFEDAFSNLVINEQEYLCVELRVRLPSAEAGQPDRHVTIFQGAVSWDAINTTFQKQTTPKSICALHPVVGAGSVGSASVRLTPSRSMSGPIRTDRGAGRVHHDAWAAVQGPLPGGRLDHRRRGGWLGQRRRCRATHARVVRLGDPAWPRQDGPGMRGRETGLESHRDYGRGAHDASSRFYKPC